MCITKEKAHSIAAQFLDDMNPSRFDGRGPAPESVNLGMWACDLTVDYDLNITITHDPTFGPGAEWRHVCEIAAICDTYDAVDSLSNPGISEEDIAATVFDLLSSSSIV